MSRRAIGGFALSVLISLCVPSQAEEAKITIIRPPPLAVKISPPREVVSIVSDRHDNRSVNQAVAVTIVTVASPYYGDRYRWSGIWDGRYDWAGYGLRGGTRAYSGPRYPF
jgi:hypothetical protein